MSKGQLYPFAQNCCRAVNCGCQKLGQRFIRGSAQQQVFKEVIQ